MLDSSSEGRRAKGSLSFEVFRGRIDPEDGDLQTNRAQEPIASFQTLQTDRY